MTDALRKAEIDRLAELANVGAGHAAAAFAQLTGETIRIDVPELIEGGAADGGSTPSASVADGASSGVFFEFEGCLDAIVGILFPGHSSERLVRRIVGIESGGLQAEIVESALMEVGNILASHVASAIADTLGLRLLPSIPSLAMVDAEKQLEDLIERSVGRDALRIVSALYDDTGSLRGQLVLVPTRWPALES
ncbi:MAG: hypothetical protein CL908_22000 [Deltaproteobacteria bacterium]|jgi:chemotaxis protein CheC|nr:hypothetical protein [Deltaproteobacteria bacterium]